MSGPWHDFADTHDEPMNRPTPESLTAADLAPARAGGFRRLTFDNGAHEDYQAVFVQHSAGEWDRILIARDDGRIARLLADLINAAARAGAGLDVGLLREAGQRALMGGMTFAAAEAIVAEYDRLRAASPISEEKR